jgi:hypothetical protein
LATASNQSTTTNSIYGALAYFNIQIDPGRHQWSGFGRLYNHRADRRHRIVVSDRQKNDATVLVRRCGT